MRENAMLMDINGDGKLDWVISQPGLAGYFSRDPDLSRDLILAGPNSSRYLPCQRSISIHKRNWSI